MTSFVVVVFLRVIARYIAAVVAALDQNQASTILHVHIRQCVSNILICLGLLSFYSLTHIDSPCLSVNGLLSVVAECS